MTRQEFFAKAIRTAERALYVPTGWWGRWRDVTNGTVRVAWSRSGGWRITVGGHVISRHDSRSSAIRKAANLGRGKSVTS